MDVVLAWGSMIAVSEPSHADLYWACKVRHIFDIVTCLKKEKRKEDFQYSVPGMVCDIYMFYNDRLEAIFEQLDIVGANGTQPKETVTYSLYILNPEIGATKVGTPDSLLQGGVDALISHHALSQ